MMQEKVVTLSENLAPMIRDISESQLSLAEFDWPFQTSLDEQNRWVKLSQIIPWDALSESYAQNLSLKKGRPAKPARLVIGAVIIKHKLGLSDEETVAQIQENPYLQYFVGLKGYQMAPPFVPSLLVEIRKRMGSDVFDQFHQSLVEAVGRASSARVKGSEKKGVSDDNDESGGGSPAKVGATEQQAVPKCEPQGKLILDATVAPQAIRYPTDISLLNEARERTEDIIDCLFAGCEVKQKPRTYRQQARKDFLAIVKQRRPSGKARRKSVKQQLQYLRRNLKHIEGLLAHYPEGEPLPLPNWLLQRYWVIPHLYEQQVAMYKDKSRRCDDRIVSLSQPWIRPIIRGKLDKPVEFGAKLSVSLTGEGLAKVDRLSWDAFHEGGDLKHQVESFRQQYGCYPATVLADPVYGTRDNRKWLKDRGIHFAGKPLGRPRKETDENREELRQLKARQREEYRQRIPIEGKFGQGKTGYGLNYIKARRMDTSSAWINSIFLVMNLLVLIHCFCACKMWLESRFRQAKVRVNTMARPIRKLLTNQFSLLWRAKAGRLDLALAF